METTSTLQDVQMEPATKQTQPTPESIMQIGMGFWASKVLLAAVKFELFTLLEHHSMMSAQEIKSKLSLNCTERHTYDFLDTLTAFGFLERKGLLETAKYSNGLNASVFLDKKKPSYIGGILEMANNRLYRAWGDLEDGLLTGQPQNEIKYGETNLFAELYKSPEKLREFMTAMGNAQMGNFIAFAEKFDFSHYQTLVDAGGAGGLLSIMVSKNHPHMHCISFDLPAVQEIADANINRFEVSVSVKAVSGDFFSEPLPKTDVVVMGNILHDWDEEKKILLIKKAYEALNTGGAFVAIENVIDDDRRQNAFGMMMSLNMLIETGTGFDYTFSEFTEWAKKVGFSTTTRMSLAGPASAAIAYK